MKKLICYMICACLLCATGCAGSNSAEEGNLVDMKTVREILDSTDSADLRGGQSIEKFTKLFYKNQIQYNEGFFVAENQNGEVEPVRLLFPVAYALEVTDNNFETVYKQGSDYVVTDDGMLTFPSQSRIKAMPRSLLFLDESADGEWLYNEKAGADEGKAVTSDKFLLYKHQYVITYIRTEVYTGAQAVLQDSRLPHVSRQLRDKKSVNMLYVGDSIGAGAGGSENFDNFADMIATALSEKTGARVENINCSVGGMDSASFVSLIYEEFSKINPKIINTAKAKLQLINRYKSHADLVFIALGTNDAAGSVKSATFKLNIEILTDFFREANPDVSIVFVAGMIPNDKIKRAADNRDLYNYDIGLYRDALKELSDEYPNSAVADVFGVQQSMLSRKKIEDLIADNLNHPTDYMARIYAQVLLGTVIG